MIADAEEKKSAAGNDMIEVVVRVSDGHGRSRLLTDCLLPQRAGKLYNCCAAIGILPKYENGCLSEDDSPGKTGRLRLTVEKKKGFAPPNVIADYIAADEPAAGPIRLAS